MSIEEYRIKIIFIDFDGVLNRFHGENPTKLKSFKGGTIGLDPELIKNFNFLSNNLDKSWQFIISSSWKIYGMGHCIRELIEKGFDLTELQRFKDRTGNGKTRAEEILNYIDKYNSPVDFIIIDDESFDLIGNHPDLNEEMVNRIIPNFFQTNMKDGLTIENVNEILKMTKK